MLEKKYKVQDLYVGVIARQGSVSVVGSLLKLKHQYSFENFDVGIFIKKGNDYMRVTTKQIYPISSYKTGNQIVINETAINPLAHLSPDLIKEYKKIDLKKIEIIEQAYKKHLIEQQKQELVSEK